MGGLFKDFWTDLSARVFDPNYGLFCVTAQQVRAKLATFFRITCAVIISESKR